MPPATPALLTRLKDAYAAASPATRRALAGAGLGGAVGLAAGVRGRRRKSRILKDMLLGAGIGGGVAVAAPKAWSLFTGATAPPTPAERVAARAARYPALAGVPGPVAAPAAVVADHPVVAGAAGGVAAQAVAHRLRSRVSEKTLSRIQRPELVRAMGTRQKKKQKYRRGQVSDHMARMVRRYDDAVAEGGLSARNATRLAYGEAPNPAVIAEFNREALSRLKVKPAVPLRQRLFRRGQTPLNPSLVPVPKAVSTAIAGPAGPLRRYGLPAILGGAAAYGGQQLLERSWTDPSS